MEKSESKYDLSHYFEKRISNISLDTVSQKTSNPFITISRLTGAGGVDFPDLLLDYLNTKLPEGFDRWTLFDKNILDNVIRLYDLPKDISKFMSEEKISEFQVVIEQLFGLHPSDTRMIRKVSMTILHLANIGNAIFVGRGSNIITAKLQTGLHLRLIESFDKRLLSICKHYNISKSEGMNLIRNEDKNRENYIKKYFNEDINNPNIYTLLINFDKVNREYIFELIMNYILSVKKRN